MRLPGPVLIALLAVTIVSALAMPALVAVTEQACPDEATPNSMGRVGELFLPDGAVPYTRIAIYRHMLAPGETLPAKPDRPVMYIVESGNLAYPVQPWTGIYLSPSCVSDVAHHYAIADASSNLSGGSISVSEEDLIRVTTGQTVVAENGLIGPLRNGGTAPLVLLEVRVTEPEIDSESGLPIVDPVTAARELNREFLLRKQACQERLRALAKGTPVTYLPVYIEAPEPTPAFTTDARTSDEMREGRKVPRTCKGQNAP